MVGKMRFAGQALRSIKFALFRAADRRNVSLVFDLEGYLRKLALRVTWPSFEGKQIWEYYRSVYNPYIPPRNLAAGRAHALLPK
jgi:hypothetical protein